MQTTKPVTKPTKQRKRVFQAPDHMRYKLFAAPLSKELKSLHGTRSLPVRTGDTVRIMRGDHAGFEGKISRVERKKYRIYVEGLTREKVDGTTIFLPVHPSKVMVMRLNLDDKWRKKILERKKEVTKEAEKVAEKPPKEIVKAKEEIAKEKLPEKKTRRKKAVTKKPKAKKTEEKPEETEKKVKPKARRTRAKSKTTEKKTGGT